MEASKLKSRLQRDGFYNTNYFEINYLAAAAAWIANFGVVPLFLLAAFLFAPAFFFFLNLLFVVTHVLETIRKLLCICSYHIRLNFNFKPSFLPIKSLCVKGILLGLCTISLIPPKAKAIDSERDLVIARGQTIQLSLPAIQKFNFSNKQVLSYQFNEVKSTILIRGKQLGHSEFIVWNKGNDLVETYQIYVISKSQESKLIHIGLWANRLGLVSSINMPHVKISGLIKSLNQYLEFKKLLSKDAESIIDNVEISPQVSSKIIAEIYSAFFNDFKETISCNVQNSTISCEYPANESPSESLKKFLFEKYKIEWVLKNGQKNQKNYLVKLKLIQLEQLDGEEMRLGLEQLSGTLSDFIDLPIKQIVGKNQTILSKRHLHLSTLAEPHNLVRPQVTSVMQIGSDIPFKSTNAQNVTTTEWHFAGLKVHLTLENFADNLKIDYETELTQPTSDNSGNTSIGGNKEQSSIVIPLNKAVKMFQISLRTDGKSNEQLPYLGRVPILGEIFKSRSNQQSFKTITGILKVENYD